MIRLTELRHIAVRVFPGSRPTLISLLVAWAQVDPDEELAGLLKGTGIGKRQFRTALDPFVGEEDSDDRALLVKTASASQSDPATGNRLLRCLAESPDHRVHRALVAAGMDMPAFEQALTASCELESLLTAAPEAADSGFKSILKYGRDLTAEAAGGAFDGLCDRPEEIETLVGRAAAHDQGQPNADR